MRGEQLQALEPSLLKEFENMLDDQKFGGVLLESRMVELIEMVVGSSKFIGNKGSNQADSWHSMIHGVLKLMPNNQQRPVHSRFQQPKREA